MTSPYVVIVILGTLYFVLGRMSNEEKVCESNLESGGMTGQRGFLGDFNFLAS